VKPPDDTLEPRQRILGTAYDLFTRFGFPTVGVDRIVAEAGVAKMTLYRHFRSKDELAVAVLERREELWTKAWLVDGVERRATAPAARLLAIFDVFDEWFARESFEGCLFTNSLIESHDRASAVGAAGVEKLENVRRYVQELAQEAGIRDEEDFARKWQLLMEGSITAAVRGDRNAARRAQQVASLLLEQERPGRAPATA
jgi:AcrR family transcriptional regulator